MKVNKKYFFYNHNYTMENKDTEYINGDADDFTIFLFSEPPKEENSIKLELSPSKKKIHIGLHIFQELLMIFTEGMKYLFSQEEKCDITKLETKDIELMNRYFKSIGFIINVEVFTIKDYLDNMKLPNYFLKQELIQENTPLDSFYYETSFNSFIYRISFSFLRV
tara:strand:- start:842 stop:1336 length:495 start_codon:yes stop_codon:yes gene_type:complete